MLEKTINNEKYLFTSSVDYIDLKKDSKKYKKLLKAMQLFFDDNTIDELSCLDDDSEVYFSISIFENSIAVFKSFGSVEKISFLSIGEDNVLNKELAYCVLVAEEAIVYDSCSLLTLEKLEDIERFKYIQIINSLKINNIKENTIAEVLNINYKSLNKSPKKEMYFNLYKQKLITLLFGD